MKINHLYNSSSFLESFSKLISIDEVDSICGRAAHGLGAPSIISTSEILIGLVYHFFTGAGALATHVDRLLGKKMSNSALTQRRANLPMEIFEKILKVALKPLALLERHTDCFYKGLRLVAIDGSQFSAPNRAPILDKWTKSVSRRLESAFVKIGICTLIEIGTHHPLAVAIAEDQESELALAFKILGSLPSKSLLIADRLFGTGSTIEEITKICKNVESSFFIRVRSNLKTKVKEIYSDGSALVEVAVRDEENPNKIKSTLLVREVRARIQQPGKEWSTMIFWTNFFDATLYPASELVPLYAKRWEHELYYKQLKIDLHCGELLQSQTAETCLQEVAALILASAILAQERLALADSEGLPSVRVSLAKVQNLLDALWIVLKAAQTLFNTQQCDDLITVTLATIRKEVVLPVRKPRSCPRELRQPIKRYPRLTKNNSVSGPVDIEIIPIS
jgi:hypothetical protein